MRRKGGEGKGRREVCPVPHHSTKLKAKCHGFLDNIQLGSSETSNTPDLGTTLRYTPDPTDKPRHDAVVSNSSKKVDGAENPHYRPLAK
jgi:hypothetical protein